MEALTEEASEREGEIERLEQEVVSLREAVAEQSGMREEVARLDAVKCVLASELETAKAGKREIEVARGVLEAELEGLQAEMRLLKTEVCTLSRFSSLAQGP